MFFCRPPVGTDIKSDKVGDEPVSRNWLHEMGAEKRERVYKNQLRAVKLNAPISPHKKNSFPLD